MRSEDDCCCWARVFYEGVRQRRRWRQHLAAIRHHDDGGDGDSGGGGAVNMAEAECSMYTVAAKRNSISVLFEHCFQRGAFRPPRLSLSFEL